MIAVMFRARDLWRSCQCGTIENVFWPNRDFLRDASGLKGSFVRVLYLHSARSVQ